MTKCPRCFSALNDERFAWTLADPTDVRPDEVASMFVGKPVLSGEHLELDRSTGGTDVWPPTAEFVQEILGGPSVEVCPTCHYVLPVAWRQGQATCIAMAGARATGKTVYIAVMIKQLQGLAERVGRAVEPANRLTEDIFRDVYEEPLFVERGLLQPTPSADTDNPYQREPLVFSLGEWNGIRRFLSIRDVAGEDLEKNNTEGPAWRFFGAADAVLFLFDPLRVGEISDQLRDLIPVHGDLGGDPKAVLRTLMATLGGGSPKIAVVLSKFDALQALKAVRGSEWGRIMSNAGAAFSRDSSLEAAPYANDDGILLHEEVRSLLHKLDAGPMLQTMQNSVTGQQYWHRFFAVSALGEHPVGMNLHLNGISPFRCLDPVRWVLSEQGVM